MSEREVIQIDRQIRRQIERERKRDTGKGVEGKGGGGRERDGKKEYV